MLDSLSPFFMHQSQIVLHVLVMLNKQEDECKALGPRSKKLATLQRSIKRLRSKIPAPILSHHDRVRSKNRRSTAPVQEGVCHGCFITIPLGLRQDLNQANDLYVCENCGSYIYIPDGTESKPQDIVISARAKRMEELCRISAAEAAKSPARKCKTAKADSDRLAMIRALTEKLNHSAVPVPASPMRSPRRVIARA